MLYAFHQNSIKGMWDYEGPACVVAVKAEDCNEANRRMVNELGITFDGRRWRKANSLVNDPIYNLHDWMQHWGFTKDARDHASGILEFLALD